MTNNVSSSQTNTSKLGFHYYPDTLHYTNQDLQKWLPTLKELNTSWLVLKADTNRAVPEYFIHGLLTAGISPIIDFSLNLADNTNPEQVDSLLRAYCDWGVRYFYYYDRPNQRSSWPTGSWVQEDLVERFLDRFIPYAELTIEYGGLPIFPALEPGGNYWDTAFLRQTLQSLERRKQTKLLDSLILSAYAYTYSHPLNWGIGGPESWPEAKPYFTPSQSQDQFGFRIFDWYNAISKAVIEKILPMFLFQAGLPTRPSEIALSVIESNEYNHSIVNAFHLAVGTPIDPVVQTGKNPEPAAEDLAENIVGCNFYILAANPDTEMTKFAWFDGKKALFKGAQEISREYCLYVQQDSQEKAGVANEGFFRKIAHPIHHYLLLPQDSSIRMDKQLQEVLPFIQKYRPTIGTSLDEAQMAEKVTIFADQENFNPEAVIHLQKSGCEIEWIPTLAH